MTIYQKKERYKMLLSFGILLFLIIILSHISYNRSYRIQIDRWKDDARLTISSRVDASTQPMEMRLWNESIS